MIAVPVTTKAPVVVSDHGLVIGKQGADLHIARAKIKGAVFVPAFEPCVDLFLTGGNVVRVNVPNRKTGQEIIDRLGFGPDKRRVEVRLGSPQRQLALGCFSLPLLLLIAWLISEGLGIVANLGLGASYILVGSYAVMIYLVVRALRPHEVVIGADGFAVRKPFGKTFYPFADSDEVKSKAGELRMKHRTIARGESDLVRATAKYINASSEAGPDESSHEAISNIVDKGNRSVEEWKAALVASKNESGYRNTAITPEALRAVVEDPDEDEIRRLGAAMLLRIARPDDIPRIRIAADGCANDDLRAALEAAAEDEVNEAVVKRIVEKR